MQRAAGLTSQNAPRGSEFAIRDDVSADEEVLGGELLRRTELSHSNFRKSPVRILIIDDDQSHGESLADLIQVLGHEPQYAASFDDTQWLLELFSFDLALIDFDMPTTTGVQVAKTLRRDFPQIHTVIMSARALDRETSSELVGLTFMQKPLSRSVLKELFLDLARSQSGLSIVRRASFPLLKVTDDKPTDSDDKGDAEATT